MAVRKVVRMGNVGLLQKAESVAEYNTPELDELICDMRDTMAAEDGAGLAAPQIGVSQRVVIFGCADNVRYPDAPAIPETILINPEITPADDEMENGWEGCLSLPGMRGLVPRFKRIRYTGFDEKGLRIDRDVDGFHARVVQHECDHLDGILYPQRIKDIRYFGYTDELQPPGVETPCDDDG